SDPACSSDISGWLWSQNRSLDRYGTVSLPLAIAIFNTAPYRSRTQQRELLSRWCSCSIFAKPRPLLLAVPAQLFEIDDSHPAIFQSKQAVLLQPLQALVGILPGQA